MSSSGADSPRAFPAGPLEPFVRALRLSLDDPRGAACDVQNHFAYLIVRPPDGRGAVALWSSTAAAQNLATIATAVAKATPAIEYGVAHLTGAAGDVLLVKPPLNGPRWVLATKRGGRTELTAWGGRLEPKLVELLQIERAEAALRHVGEELEKHFGDPSQLYFTPDALTSSSLSPTMLANAVRLVVEDAPRLRLLDVDGQAVVTRRSPDPPRASLWQQLCAVLNNPSDRAAHRAARLQALEDARLVLAVRSDRITQQLDSLRQTEWKLTGEAHAAHEPGRRAAFVQRMAAVRRDALRFTTQLEIMRAQREIVETQLHASAPGRGRLPENRLKSTELATQAAAARSLLAHIRDAAALAEAADEVIAADSARGPTAHHVTLGESKPPDTAPHAAAAAPPRLANPLESQAYEYLAEAEDEFDAPSGPPAAPTG